MVLQLLAEEIWLAIFDEIGPIYLARTLPTSKEWLRIALEPCLWHRIELHDTQYRSTRWHHWLARSAPLPAEVTLIVRSGRDHRIGGLGRTIYHIKHNMHRIRSFHLEAASLTYLAQNIQDAVTELLATPAPLLEVFSLYFPAYILASTKGMFDDIAPMLRSVTFRVNWPVPACLPQDGTALRIVQLRAPVVTEWHKFLAQLRKAGYNRVPEVLVDVYRDAIGVACFELAQSGFESCERVMALPNKINTVMRVVDTGLGVVLVHSVRLDSAIIKIRFTFGANGRLHQPLFEVIDELRLHQFVIAGGTEVNILPALWMSQLHTIVLVCGDSRLGITDGRIQDILEPGVLPLDNQIHVPALHELRVVRAQNARLACVSVSVPDLVQFCHLHVAIGQGRIPTLSLGNGVSFNADESSVRALLDPVFEELPVFLPTNNRSGMIVDS